MKKLGKLKWLLSLAAVMVLLGGFVACSDGDDSSVTPNPGVSDPNSVTKVTLIDASGKWKTFDTIQAAVNACSGTASYTIKLPKRTYKENYIHYNGAATVKISGATTTKYGADVIIIGHGENMGKEKGRELIEFEGSGNLILENLTLMSDWSRKDHAGDVQAEVLGFDSTGTVAAYNCAFKSHQDTMRTTGKGWFYKCYVEGDTDFIWMESAGVVALYEECEIVSVYDENATTHSSYVLAPRATVANTMGKGAVIFNSTLSCENDSNFLFRNPWGTNKDYYNQGAFVGVKISVKDGKTFEPTLAKSAAMGTTDQQYVGWKVDSALAAAYTGKMASIGTISDEVKSKEYNGRRAILNRNYSVKHEKFLQDAAGRWDIDALILANGWSVTADTSKDLLDGETAATVKSYVLNAETVEGLTCDGFKLETGKTHYVGQNGNTIKFNVTGPCTVAVTGYCQGVGTIEVAGQGKALYNCTNGSTAKFVTKEYVVYKTGTNAVTITATGTSYLTKIDVTYDNTITFKPVTAITVESADNTTELPGKKTLQFSATVTPASASNTDYEWSVSPASAGTITNTGLFTAADVTSEVTATISATAMDEKHVVGSKTLAVKPASANAVALTWLNNTNSSFVGASDKENIAKALEAGKAISGTSNGVPITGSWAHNSSKLADQGVSLTAADEDPEPGEWYIDYPVEAVQNMRIDTVKIYWGNCGTSNLRVWVGFYKGNDASNPTVLYNEMVKDNGAISPRTSDNPNSTFNVYQVLAAGEKGTVRISIHGKRGTKNEDGSISYSYQTINGKTPTWGTTIISGEAGNFPVAGTTYTYNLCASENLKEAGSTTDGFFSWTGANPGSGHGLQSGKGTLKVAGNVKITVGLCQFGSGTITVKNDTTEVANLTVVKMTSCYAKGVTPEFKADNSQSFTYTGSATELSFEWSSNVYLEGIQVEPVSN